MTRKLTFLILALFALISGPGWGQNTATATLTTGDYTWTCTNHVTSQIVNGITFSFSGGSTDPTYYADGLRTYEGCNITISSENTISEIVFTYTISNSGCLKNPTVGTWDNSTKTWTGNANSIGLTVGHSSGTKNGQVRITQIVVTYSAGDTPSITVNPSTITWDNSPIYVQLSETISVSQANLTSDITITSTIGNVSPSTITVGEETDVTFTYTPTTTGDFEGTITFTSDETTATVSVTGSAYDPSQVDTYELFTGELVEGDYVIYYSSYAMKNTVANNRLQNLSVTPDNNAITNPDAAIVWHIAPSGNYWTIYSEAINKYAAGTTSKNQATLIESITDYAKWTVSTSNGKYEFVNLGRANSTSDPGNKYLRNNGTNGWACYASATGGALTLYKKAENKAATPTLTESQIFITKPFEVTITNNEAGATVYYTTDGNDPTTETTTYFMGDSKTIQINTTTTVKAMAVVEGKANSTIVSATYTEQKNDPENQWSAEAYTATIGGENTFPTFSTQSDGAVTYTSSGANVATIDATTGTITLVAAGTTTITASTAETDTYMAGEASYTLTVKEAPLITMDAIFAKATTVGSTATNVDVTFNNWVISGVKGSNAYLTDNAGKGLIIYTSDHGFAVGDVLNGTIACQIKLYSGASELMGVTSETSGLTVTKNGEITIHEVSIADLSGVNTGAVIKVNNVQYNGTNLVDENSNIIKPYNAVDYNPTFTNGLKYNVTGVYIQFNTTKEIAPRSAYDIVEIVPTEPSITVDETLNLPYTESEVETLEVSYENVDFEMLDLYFYDDAGCTIESENDWFIADFTEDGSHNIEYFAFENTESTPRTVYMQINYNESELTKVITVTQEAAPQTYNVTLSSNGVVGEPQPVQGSITLSDPTIIPTGFTFAGWTESESEIQFVANPYTPTSVVTLYAVFSREEGGIAGSGNYEKVTSLNDITSGQYVIVNDGYALPNTTSTSSPVKSDDYMPTIVNDIITNMADNTIWNFTKLVSSITIKNPDGKYLYSTSSNAGLRVNNTEDSWTFEENESGFAMKDHNYSRYCATYKDGTDWRSYTSKGHANYGDGGILYLYKKDEGTPGTTHYYTRVYNKNTELASLEVAGPSIILNGYTLTVTGAMSNENPANLIIEDGAQLFQNSSDVMATVQKNITGYTGDNDNYYLIAAPIADASIEGLTTNDEYDLFSYNEPTHYWFNQKGPDNPFNTLSLGQGYLYANSKTGNVTISGIISNEQDPTIAVTASASNLTGFNLVGNPFTYNLSINDMAMMDEETEIYDITSIYQIEGTAVVASQNTSVAPCEGFFIQAPAAGELFFNFNAGSSRSAKSSVSDLKVEVKEANRSAQLLDRAYVNFSESRPMNKFYLNENSTRLYIPQNGKDYAVVMANAAEGELPMNFKAEKNGSYTITVDTENVDAEYLHLIDNMTGMDVDLLSTPSYTFDAKTSDYASRFKLVFGVKNEASESSDSNFAFMSNGNLVIDNIEGEATLQIVDELGRVISTETVSGSYNKALNLKAGLYIINLNGMTQKIVVR